MLIRYKSKDFGKVEINFNENVFGFYIPNGNHREEFIDDLYKSLKDDNNVEILGNETLSDYKIINFPEFLELKKEISLLKTSVLRKSVVKLLENDISENSINLIDDLNNLLSNLTLLKKLSLTSNSYDLSKYKVNVQSKIESNSDIIDNLFDLKVLDKESNDSYSEKELEYSEIKKIYLDLFINQDSSKYIFIFNCPETFFDNKEIKEFLNWNRKISIKNKVIIFTRSLDFLIESDFTIKNVKALSLTNKIPIDISNSLIKKWMALLDYDEKEFPNFDMYIHNALTVISESDVIENLKTISNYIFIILKRFDLKDYLIKDLEFFKIFKGNSDFILLLFIFLKFNQIPISSEINKLFSDFKMKTILEKI